MDFVTVRELRAESGKVWEKIEAGEEIVITRNGKPFALLVHTEPGELVFPVRAQVLKKDVAKHHRRGAFPHRAGERLPHGRFVFRFWRTWPGGQRGCERHDDQRQAQRCRLLLHQSTLHVMHADSVHA